MNYTPNFHLPQWDKDDRIMMDDFNQMVSHLENALSLSQDATQRAQQAAQAAQTAANGAQSAAQTAQNTADQAQAGVDQAMIEFQSRLKMHTGFFTGKGGTWTFETSYFPWFAIIIGGEETTCLGDQRYCGYLMVGCATPFGQIVENGLLLRDVDQSGYPNLNKKGYHYVYVTIHL